MRILRVMPGRPGGSSFRPAPAQPDRGADGARLVGPDADRSALEC